MSASHSSASLPSASTTTTELSTAGGGTRVSFFLHFSTGTSTLWHVVVYLREPSLCRCDLQTENESCDWIEVLNRKASPACEILDVVEELSAGECPRAGLDANHRWALLLADLG